MKYEEFLGVLMSYKSLSEDFSELYGMGFIFFKVNIDLKPK
jgi:hypothetical protein